LDHDKRHNFVGNHGPRLSSKASQKFKFKLTDFRSKRSILALLLQGFAFHYQKFLLLDGCY